MTSKKISQLPPSATVELDYLFPLVNTDVSPIETQYALISQLPKVLDDSIIGSIEVPVVKTYVLELFVTRPYTINTLYLSTRTGTANVTLRVKTALDVNVFSSSSISVTSSPVSLPITGATAGAGEKLVLEVTSTTAAEDLSFTIKTTYLG